MNILVVAHDRESEKLKDKTLGFITRDQATLKAAMDLPEFDELNLTITREFLVFSQGGGSASARRRRSSPTARIGAV